MEEMEWENPEIRATALKLWTTRVLKRTGSNQPLLQYLLDLGWITQSSRHRELMLNAIGIERLPTLLNRLWPKWRQTLQELEDRNLPLSPEGLAELMLSNRSIPPLPPRLHRKTYAALVGEHSKCTSNSRLSLNMSLTADDILRMRTSNGLILRMGSYQISCDELMAVAGEVILPERALLDGLAVCGVPPKMVFTVENLGPFVDMEKPEECLLIHQPGWNTPLSLMLMRLLGNGTSIYHFGDLDPKGLAIFLHLKNAGINTRLFLPCFWAEYLQDFSLPLTGMWPQCIKDFFNDPLLQELFTANTWLEQEPIVLDKRFISELKDLLSCG